MKEVAIVAAVMSSHPRVKRGAPRQVVFSFDEGAPETRIAAVRGGKGASLATMTALGLPVPPGFTVATTVVRAFNQTGTWPNRVHDQFMRCLRKLERQTRKEFGNPDNPLLVSVRSGAQASMPGMMDTVLNVGLNPSTVAGLARLQGRRFALDAYCRFLVQFGAVVLQVPPGKLEYVLSSTRKKAGEEIGELSVDTLSKTCERLREAIELMTERDVPDDPWDQLDLAMEAVLRSWSSERAQAYRQANNLPSWWGTAITVQAMVFGNRSKTSGAGVVFSHDVTTGQPGLSGEFLPKAQGEDVVAGTHDPLPISALAEWNPDVYQDLELLVAQLVDHIGDIVDVEFTVEDGQLYLLQVRPAKRSALAAVTYAVHQVWAGCMTREQAIEIVSSTDVDRLQRAEFATATSSSVLARGLAASPGAAVGCVAFSSKQAQVWSALGKKVVLVSRDTTPDDLPGMLCAQALITGNGGASCHAAVVAREQGLPAVVGAGETLISQLTEGQLVSVDGTTGIVYDGSVELVNATLTKEANIFLRWVDRFKAYQPKIGFEWYETQQNVNQWLNDFYLSDLMATASKGSALEQEAKELRTKIHQQAAEMLVAYLMVAVGGELQYTFGYLGDSAMAPKLEVLRNQYGIVSNHEVSHETIYRRLITKFAETDNTAHAEFFRFADEVFSLDCWRSRANFGGEAWAKIARAGYMFLSGAWSPTVFVDHAFDLRHNGGRLFDKHPMVARKTDDDHILCQLNEKKYVQTVRHLRDNLIAYARVSQPVEDLFTRGMIAHLW